jgi:DNA-binding transcriptional MocR family regulator
MRATYREHLEAVGDAAARCCDGALRLRTVLTGLHAVADLHGVDEARVCQEAKREIEVSPLGMYFVGRPMANRLVLGFASSRPDILHRGNGEARDRD